MVGLGGLARWVTLQHYFGTTLLKVCRLLLYMMTNTHLWSHLDHFFLEWQTFHKKVVEKHFMFNSFWFFLSKIAPFMKQFWKICKVRQATDDKLAHAHCTLDTRGHKHTLGIRNTYCFSTATIVARKRLNVTINVHCLFCPRISSPLATIRLFVFVTL